MGDLEAYSVGYACSGHVGYVFHVFVALFLMSHVSIIIGILFKLFVYYVLMVNWAAAVFHITWMSMLGGAIILVFVKVFGDGEAAR